MRAVWFRRYSYEGFTPRSRQRAARRQRFDALASRRWHGRGQARAPVSGPVAAQCGGRCQDLPRITPALGRHPVTGELAMVEELRQCSCLLKKACGGCSQVQCRPEVSPFYVSSFGVRRRSDCVSGGLPLITRNQSSRARRRGAWRPGERTTSCPGRGSLVKSAPLWSDPRRCANIHSVTFTAIRGCSSRRRVIIVTVFLVAIARRTGADIGTGAGDAKTGLPAASL